MNEKRIAAALAALREEGFAITVTPGSVDLTVALMTVRAPGKSTRDVEIEIDGFRIENLLCACEVRLAVGEITRVKLEGFPPVRREDAIT